MNDDNVPSTGLRMLFMETIDMSICFEGLIFGQKGILNPMDAVARCIFCVSLVLTFCTSSFSLLLLAFIIHWHCILELSKYAYMDTHL